MSKTLKNGHTNRRKIATDLKQDIQTSFKFWRGHMAYLTSKNYTCLIEADFECKIKLPNCLSSFW